MCEDKISSKEHPAGDFCSYEGTARLQDGNEMGPIPLNIDCQEIQRPDLQIWNRPCMPITTAPKSTSMEKYIENEGISIEISFPSYSVHFLPLRSTQEPSFSIGKAFLQIWRSVFLLSWQALLRSIGPVLKLHLATVPFPRKSKNLRRDVTSHLANIDRKHYLYIEGSLLMIFCPHTFAFLHIW